MSFSLSLFTSIELGSGSVQSILESTGESGLKSSLGPCLCPGHPLPSCDWEAGAVTPWVELTATVADVLVIAHTSGARPKSDAS